MELDNSSNLARVRGGPTRLLVQHIHRWVERQSPRPSGHVAGIPAAGCLGISAAICDALGFGLFRVLCDLGGFRLFRVICDAQR